MGRCAWVLVCAVFVVCGCAAPRSSVRSSAQMQWSRVCTALSSAGTPHDAPPAGICTALSLEAHSALARAAAAAAPALVQIHTDLQAPVDQTAHRDGVIPVAARSGGTGVVIEAGGVVLTNEHVVRNAAAIKVILADGRQCDVAAVAVDRVLDLAILRLDACDLPTLTLGDHPATGGAPVIALAAVTARGPDRTCFGVVLAPSVSLQSELDPAATRDYRHLIESTTALEPGYSGGPLLDGAGRFVGLNVATRTRADGARRGYALPLDEATCSAIARLVAATRPH
jgi:S1-C subfamily serine protease